MNLYYNKIHTIEKLWNICNASLLEYQLLEVEQQSARAQALAEIGQSWKESSKVYSIETEEDKKPIISPDDIAIQELESM